MPTVCLDFDDTLRAPGGEPVPGAREACAELRDRGTRLVVSSARFSPIYGELNAKRAETVDAWLIEQAIEVDALAIRVPDADVYLDDRGWRWTDWEADLPPLRDLIYPRWREHEPGCRGKGALSVSLDALWHDDAPRPGAQEALAELARLEVPVSVCAIQAGDPPRAIRERLRGARLEVGRVETGKVGAEVYVNPRALEAEGDWPTTLEAILTRLG